MVNISPTEKEILKVLIEKPRTYYSLWKHDEVARSNKTVLQALRKLLTKNLIKKIGEKESSGSSLGGRKKKFYGPTLFGVLVAFSHNLLSTEHVDYLVDTFKNDLPLVFGEWNYFVEQGVEEIVKKHLVNSIKHFGNEYLKFKFVQRFKEMKIIPERYQREWSNEKYWAIKVTDMFLYYGLKFKDRNELTLQGSLEELEKDLGIILSINEKSKHERTIRENKKLRLYVMMLAKHEMHSNRLRMFEWGDPEMAGDLHRSPELIRDKLIETLIWKLHKRKNPIIEIVDAIYKKDYFTAAFELHKLYRAFPFENDVEMTWALFQIVFFMIKMRFPKIKKASFLQKIKGLKPPKEIIEHLDKAYLEILAASYFFKFEPPIKVWGHTFYRVVPHEERIKMLQENREQTKKEALVFAHKRLKEIRRKDGGIMRRRSREDGEALVDLNSSVFF